MNFTGKPELETHLAANGWRNIPTYEVNISADALTHWYKSFPDVKPPRRNKEPVQICVLVYSPPEAPGQDIVSISITAEKHDEKWIKFEAYSIGLRSLNPEGIQTQIDDLISAWKGANAAGVSVKAMETHERVADWQTQTDDALRLRCGEMTAQEIRTVRAVLAAILPK